MSGFLTGMIEKEDTYDNSVKGKLLICFNRIKRLYPLYIITFFVSIVIYYDVFKISIINNLILCALKAIFNLLLCQSLVPRTDFYFSFNSVSWYLSTYIFIIFIFQYIEGALVKKTKKQLICIAILILGIQILISTGLLGIQIRGGFSIPAVVSDDIIKWTTYISPMYRLIDFSIGFIAGRLFVLTNISMVSVKKVYFFQIIAFAAIPLLQYIYYSGVKNPIIDPFRYSLIYLVDAVVLVFTCAINRGVISVLLSNKVLVWIGGMSGYAFLIHQLVIVCCRNVFIKLSNCSNIIIPFMSFIITIGLSYLYHCIIDKRILCKVFQ